MPAPGFQAIILCGPGSSFPTFTANPDENPKALIPIANRPMVWYPIDFCYRMGITSESRILLLLESSSYKMLFLYFHSQFQQSIVFLHYHVGCFGEDRSFLIPFRQSVIERET